VLKRVLKRVLNQALKQVSKASALKHMHQKPYFAGNNIKSFHAKARLSAPSALTYEH
jgi:hypothetical protein